MGKNVKVGKLRYFWVENITTVAFGNGRDAFKVLKRAGALGLEHKFLLTDCLNCCMIMYEDAWCTLNRKEFYHVHQHARGLGCRVGFQRPTVLGTSLW